jgi:hypothetical protein
VASQVSARLQELRADVESAAVARDRDTRSGPIVTCWKWRQALPECNDDVLFGLVDALYDYYLGAASFDSIEDVDRLRRNVFPDHMHTPHADIGRYNRYFEAYIFELWTACINRQSIDYDNNKELQRRLTIILERHKLVATIRQNMALLRETADESRPVSFTSLDTLQLVKEDQDRLNPYQQSLLLVLNECYRNQFCRRGDSIYERVYYGNQFTHVYKFRSDITKFVYSVSGEDKTSTAWETLTTSHNLHKQVIEYLSNCINSYLPLYEADRHKLAFRNGVYSTLEDKFWLWSEVPPGSIACNFIDQQFDYFPDKTNFGQFWPNGEESDHDQDWWGEVEQDWFNIPTPYFDKLFRTQWRKYEPGVPAECVVENPETVMRFNWAFLGRTWLYWLNELDNWQKQYVIIGAGGTGKSAILNILKRIFKPEDVAVAASSMETTFGLAGMHDAFVWTISEMTKDFKMVGWLAHQRWLACLADLSRAFERLFITHDKRVFVVSLVLPPLPCFHRLGLC